MKLNSKKRRLGGQVFHLDYDIWVECRKSGISDVELNRMKQELFMHGIKNNANLAAAVAIRDKKNRGLKF